MEKPNYFEFFKLKSEEKMAFKANTFRAKKKLKRPELIKKNNKKTGKKVAQNRQNCQKSPKNR